METISLHTGQILYIKQTPEEEEKQIWLYNLCLHKLNAQYKYNY